MNTPAPSLYGLILAGGASRRMQRDKAALAYHGKSQLAWSYELLAKFTERCFVSVRPDQLIFRCNFVTVLAFAAHPRQAWLVLACDLPFLTEPALRHLITRRDPTKFATAYRSAHDGLPEPLCAIWEPASSGPVHEWLQRDQRCPRKFLRAHGVELLDALEPAALDNVNTPEEYRASQAALSGRA